MAQANVVRDYNTIVRLRQIAVSSEKLLAYDPLLLSSGWYAEALCASAMLSHKVSEYFIPYHPPTLGQPYPLALDCDQPLCA